MPPRFRRPEPMTTFELVPDDEREPDDLPGMPDPDDDRPGRLAALRDRVADRWRRLSRRSRATIAASTAVVVLAAATAAVGPGVLDAHDQRQRAAAVRGLPGAVDDLSQPLAETWDLGSGGTTGTVLADGTVVVTDGEDAVAADPTTGRERWRRPVGQAPRCGAAVTMGAVRPAVAPDVLVCVGAAAGGPQVTALDPSGEVLGTRTVQGREVLPAGDGAVAVVATTSSLSVSVPVEADEAERLRAVQRAGWHAVTLRLEDAVTGDVRGVASIALDDVDLQTCGYQDGGDSEMILELDPWTFAGDLTTTQVCDAVVALTSTGAEIPVDDDLAGWPASLPDGRVSVPGRQSRIFDTSGALVATVPGAVMSPLVDDQPDGPLVAIGVDRTGQVDGRLTSVTDEGDVVWSHDVRTLTSVVARVRGTLVLVDGGRVVGLDAATGEERWAGEKVMRGGAEGPGEYVLGAVTDGTRVLLVSTTLDGTTRLVAVDLRDGAVAWTRELEASPQRIVAAGGHPVLLGTDGAAAHGLGR
ncbi:PQQ-binding-like beta-propeller repeat protein [Isoptericola sp. NPDC057653]|uniref:outer membrane protein assembly factor BamB family protein n=1 Tax=Isoptericola sp. NPDC057653 TaxID=3346195 RepID=UPI003679E305